MEQKSLAWVAYITLIGWIIALVQYNGSTEKTSLVRFHLRQAFGLMVTSFAIWIVLFMLLLAIPFLWFLSYILWLALLAFWILGLISAINGEEKPLPVVGELFQKWFTFIN